MEPKLTDDLFLVEESTHFTLTAFLKGGPTPNRQLEDPTVTVDQNGVILDGRLRWKIAQKWDIPVEVQEVNKNPYFVRIAANSSRRTEEANAFTYLTLFEMAGLDDWRTKGQSVLIKDFSYSENMADRIINLIKLKLSGDEENPPDYLIGNVWKPSINFRDLDAKKEAQGLMKEIKAYAKANKMALGEAVLFVIKNGIFAVRGKNDQKFND